MSLGLFLAMPMSALAQEDGGTVEDGAMAVEDAGTVTEDAAVVETDAGTVEDDAGTGDIPCGDVTTVGACSGNMLQFCEVRQGETVGHLVELDCTVDSGEEGSLGDPARHCGLVDCDDAPYPDCWGYWCVQNLGEDCESNYCDGPALAQFCDENNVCSQGTACDQDTYQVACAGDTASYCDPYSVEEAYDCSNGGADPYTCVVPTAADTAFCVGLEGGQCGTGQDGVTQFVCADGLTCTGGICSAGSTDAGTSTGTDSGTASGTDAGTGDSASGCAATSTGASVAMILFGLAGLAVIRRRR